MKNVRIIPPKPKENKKLRVAAYCRVSTSGPEQMRSLDIQISAYTKMIKSHPNWLFAGIHYDIESGLRRSGRDGFEKMLKKAAKGKIDYIITKSISRVSRDTLEVLKIIRFLRERGINMHFENENVDSINADKEFEITLRGMLVQDESRNTSENIQWGFQRKFENGDIFTKYKNFMGYTCVDGEIVIVPEQAEITMKFLESYMNYVSDIEPEDFDICPVLLTQPEKDGWTPQLLSDPFLDLIQKVPVTKTLLRNGSYYPIEAEALADLHKYAIEFIQGQLNQ